MTHAKFFKHFAYSFFQWNIGEYPDTEHFSCPECGAEVQYHGDDMDLPIGEEYWECTGCGFRFKISDFEEYEYYYNGLECPECGASLDGHYQAGTGQPIKWECEECNSLYRENDNGDLEEI